jgi:hypothetical protein
MFIKQWVILFIFVMDAVREIYGSSIYSHHVELGYCGTCVKPRNSTKEKVPSTSDA